MIRDAHIWPRCEHHYGEVLLFDRFGDETEDPRRAEFASAACSRCGRLAIDIDGVPHRGQRELAEAS